MNADKLSFSDLKKFHDDNMANKPYDYCVVASAKKVNMSDMEKIGTVKTLSLSEIFGY